MHDYIMYDCELYPVSEVTFKQYVNSERKNYMTSYTHTHRNRNGANNFRYQLAV